VAASRRVDGVVHEEDAMLRLLVLLAALPLALGAPDALAQARKGGGAMRVPTAKDPSVGVVAYMRDAGKNELLVATRVWPDYPEYNATALQRFFAMMKAMEPAYRKDDEVAYSWQQKARVTKCSIYLESEDAGNKAGTGAVVGCEANGVSSLAVPSAADPKRPSGSQDPKHLSDVMEMFKKQSERARSTVAK
jgi:hypothetical protein